MDNFIVVPINAVRKGEKFTPIEKMGDIVFNPKRKKFERAWIKSRKSYVMVGRCHGIDEDGKDGLFALGDYAIVERVDDPRKTGVRTSPVRSAKATVADLLSKFAR
jgi:hypothetical protein